METIGKVILVILAVIFGVPIFLSVVGSILATIGALIAVPSVSLPVIGVIAMFLIPGILIGKWIFK